METSSLDRRGVAWGAVAVAIVVALTFVGSGPCSATDWRGSTRVDRLAPFLEGCVVLAWATATFWFPLMVAIGVWGHLVRRMPVRYHPSYWAMVFPLGMYGAATFRRRAAIGLDAFEWLP